MKRVLIVDDSVLIIEQLTDTLVSLGYAVAGSASSGAQAVDQARLLNPDIILMDIVMPGDMDGIDAAAPIRDELDIPIIFMTAYEDEKSIDRVKEARAHGYLLKPIRSLDLKASIEIALQKKESEARFRDLYREVVEETSDLIYAIDERGNIKFTNEQAIRLTGYTREEVIGRSFASFLTPDSVKRVSEIFRRRLEGEAVGPFEVELFDSSGGLHVIEVRERLVWDDGRVVEVHGIGRDVTERKRAEEALRKNEERYRIITDNMQESVWVLDKEFKPIYVSPVAMRTRGYTFEEILALPLKENMTTESFERIVSVIIDLLNRKSAGSDESTLSQGLDLEWIRRDGTHYWTEVVLTLIFDERGQLSEVLGVGRDITERRKAEEALRKSEERYRLLAEYANDIIFTADMTMRFTYISPSVTRVRGLTVEEAMAQTPDQILTPSSLDLLVSVYREELEIEARGGTEDPMRTRTLELEEYRRDRTIVWTETTFSGLRDEKGNLVGFLGITRDISERKQAERALVESELKYRTLTENAKEAIVVLQDGVIKFLNPRAVKLSGYAKDEIISRPFLELIHPDDRAAVVSRYTGEIAGESFTNPNIYRIIVKDGAVRWVEGIGVSIVWEDKPASLSFITDITDRKQAEEALRESEAKFRGVFETSRDFMYISSLDGTIIDYNPSARELFGYTDEEMRTITMSDLYYDPQDGAKLTEELTAEGFVENYELRLKRKDGSSVDALANATVRKDVNGAIIGFQGAIKDITQIKRMEQYLLQTEKLSGLGTMISGVAHELNNPLTGIMGSAELLLMDRNLPEKTKKSAKAILKESERAAAIVGGLLSFAREHKPGRKTVDINKIIVEAYRLRQYNFKIGDIAVNLCLSKSLPPTSADPHQLHQVFTNIINNAYDALMEKGGGTLAISSGETSGSLVVAFEDDGPGIDEENLKKIFDPFFTTKDVGKGTGLGLSMAYGIIKEHGGDIEVQSEKGKGATFIVSIPISSQTGEEGQETVERRPAQKASHAGKRILVVDDEKQLRDMLREALSRMGYVVEVAASGQEALGLIERNKFDAVVADIKMPEMDGRELYGNVLNRYPEIAERFLFITGDILGEETRVFLDVSECRYIAKPFRIDEFLTLLDQVLER